MKKFTLLFCFCFLLIVKFSAAQAPNWLWAEGGGGDFGYGEGLAIGTSNNLFISGRVGGSMTLGGLSVTGSAFVPFVGRFDTSGGGVWLQAFSSGSDYVYGFDLDNKSNVYSTGVLNSGGGIYIVKYNNNGALVWNNNISSASNCGGYGVAADNWGNVYSTGDYGGAGGGSITFGTTTLPYGGSAWAGYITKSDSNGNFKWATYFSSTVGTNNNYTVGRGCVTDASGNVYISGSYQDTAIFYSANGNPSVTLPGVVSSPSSYGNLFIAKYDSSGNVLWVTTAAGAGLLYNSWSQVLPLVIDSCGNLYVTGSFGASATFGNFLVSGTGTSEVYVAKYNASEQWEWVQTAGGSGNNVGTCITLDKNSDVYVSGAYSSTPFTIGDLTLNSGNTFVAKYANSNGALQWVQSATSNGIGGIAVDKQKYVYVDGSIDNSATFGSIPVTVSGDGTFIAKLDTVPARTIVPSLSANYCPGEITTIAYSITGTFNSGNVFTAQLSDSVGSFANPINIGSTTSTTSGAITVTIPAGASQGTTYLVRVVSSNPATSSYVNGCGAYYQPNVYINDFYVSIYGSINVLVTPSDISICVGSSVLLTAYGGAGGVTYLWGNGATTDTTTVYPTKDTTYHVIVSYGTCAGSDTVTVNVDSCNHYVWPGDANDDLVVNNYDLIQIGLYYNETGPARDSVTNEWAAQTAMDWGVLQSDGYDLKYVDCNGDGTINSDDTMAVTLNYGRTHQYHSPRGLSERSSGTPLYFIADSSSYHPGSKVHVAVWLGTSTIPVSTIYALGYDVDLNTSTSLIQPATLSFNDDNSFIGTKNTNALTLTQLNNDVETVVTRTNHHNVSGYGKIGDLYFTLSSSISVPQYILSFESSEAVDSAGNAVPLQPSNDTLTILTTSSIKQLSVNSNQLSVYPNPTSGELTILSNQPSIQEIEIDNVLGETMLVYAPQFNKAGTAVNLDVSRLTDGMYFVRITSNNETITKKIIVNK